MDHADNPIDHQCDHNQSDVARDRPAGVRLGRRLSRIDQTHRRQSPKSQSSEQEKRRPIAVDQQMRDRPDDGAFLLVILSLLDEKIKLINNISQSKA